ncbi:MAG: hypothetical protein IKO56_00170 [Alphaproteobacteria bacterium]|nr:hypothetical protein [Alphaproteobacteria bacterium]
MLNLHIASGQKIPHEACKLIFFNNILNFIFIMKRHFLSVVLMATAIFASSAVLTSCSKDDNNDSNAPVEQPVDESNDDKDGDKGGTTDIIENPKGGGEVDVDKPVVKADYSTVKCLNGSDYYVICLNPQAYSYLEKNNKVAGYLGVDDVNTALYIWENTFTFGSLSGNDCFGFASDGGQTAVGPKDGWCGGGWCRLTAFDFSKIDASYTLHISIRSNKDSDDWYMAFASPSLNDKEFKITKESEDDNGNAFNLNTNGKWKEFEFSVGDMIDAGVDFINFEATKGINFPAFGGFVGATVDIDAIFIYKK